MPCKDWLDIEKKYRMAVRGYSAAVSRLDRTQDFDGAWRQVESARTDADRARCALLVHQRKHMCVPLHEQTSHPEIADSGSDEFVLGDLGQCGG